jgi:hypothetical protein
MRALRFAGSTYVRSIVLSVRVSLLHAANANVAWSSCSLAEQSWVFCCMLYRLCSVFLTSPCTICALPCDALLLLTPSSGARVVGLPSWVLCFRFFLNFFCIALAFLVFWPILCNVFRRSWCSLLVSVFSAAVVFLDIAVTVALAFF